MTQLAKEPEDLARLSVEKANAGDVEGLVGLYEPNATLNCGNGKVAVGIDQIRQFYAATLATRPTFIPHVQTSALRNGNIALTWSRSGIAGIARLQPGGHWLWAVDQPIATHELTIDVPIGDSFELGPLHTFLGGQLLQNSDAPATQDFPYGIELLNDDQTPMEFVVEMLEKHMGLDRPSATRAMLVVHTKGRMSLPLLSESEANRVSELITHHARNHNHPLVCRAIAQQRAAGDSQKPRT